jgi:hypothetical protein
MCKRYQLCLFLWFFDWNKWIMEQFRPCGSVFLVFNFIKSFFQQQVSTVRHMHLVTSWEESWCQLRYFLESLQTSQKVPIIGHIWQINNNLSPAVSRHQYFISRNLLMIWYYILKYLLSMELTDDVVLLVIQTFNNSNKCGWTLPIFFLVCHTCGTLASSLVKVWKIVICNYTIHSAYVWKEGYFDIINTSISPFRKVWRYQRGYHKP